MTQINTTFQTVQTNHQQYTNQLKQLTEYKQDKNKPQYTPNSSNSLQDELTNAERCYDRLEEEFNLEKQLIETTTKYVESIVIHKEKVQSELIQQNKNMEETKNKMKEMGEKVCEIAKRDADEKNKKIEEEERKEHQRVAEKYEKELALSEEAAAEIKLQMTDPSLSADYRKLMELQTALEEQAHKQEVLLERMLESEMELEELERNE